MRTRWLLIATSLALVTTPETRAAGPEDSVVRVHAKLRVPNPVRPWTKQNPVDVMGTGVIIEGKKILTNAHVVLYASEIIVLAREGGDRFDAKVETLGPGIDLATLSLEDDAFFAKRPPMPRAPQRPAANAGVVVLGFPVGGSNLALTRGIVSRIDYAGYNGLCEGLRLQVDATVNPGSSGGPALVDGKMVGLTYGRAENIGYVIPNEEIDAYLADVKDGRYDGKLRVNDRFQVLENEALRAKLGLEKSVRGIMVHKPAESDPSYPLRAGDVLTKIGGVPIDNEGNIAYEDNLRLAFSALVPKLARSGSVAVSLIRDGKPLEAMLPVTREDDRLMRSYNGGYPTYFVHGPLVFSPVLEEAIPFYMRGNPNSIAGSPILTRSNERVAFPDEELVVVTAPLLAHKVAKGYNEPFGEVVAEVDGTKIKNLRHLVEVLRDGKGEFITFRFHGEMSETLVFRRKLMDEATEQVMSENGISRRGSDKLMAVWNTRPADGR